VIPALWTPQPGWNLETADGFDGTQLEEANWWKWSGYPGGYDQAYWDAAHVVVGGSTLQLKSTGPVTLPNGKQGYLAGGVGSQFSQTYGRYIWRAKVAAAAGTNSVALLWPAGSVAWPVGGEIDWEETWSNSNIINNGAFTLHYGANNETVQEHYAGIDLTQYHVYDCIWEPSVVSVSIDGVLVDTITNANVPSGPMRLDFQVQYIGGGTPPPSSEFVIDWVAQYSKAAA
jgi:beta-glucanase (GH16 family)